MRNRLLAGIAVLSVVGVLVGLALAAGRDEDGPPARLPVLNADGTVASEQAPAGGAADSMLRIRPITYRAGAKLPGLDGEADAWVLRVTINLALDRVRRPAAGATAGRGDEVIDLRDGVPHGVVGADDDATATRLALTAALRALPEKQRHAVALRYLAGCQEEEIAASLGVHPGTVKTHLKRGLASLRTQLGTDLENADALVAGTA